MKRWIAVLLIICSYVVLVIVGAILNNRPDTEFNYNTINSEAKTDDFSYTISYPIAAKGSKNEITLPINVKVLDESYVADFPSIKIYTSSEQLVYEGIMKKTAKFKIPEDENKFYGVIYEQDSKKYELYFEFTTDDIIYEIDLKEIDKQNILKQVNYFSYLCVSQKMVMDDGSTCPENFSNRYNGLGTDQLEKVFKDDLKSFWGGYDDWSNQLSTYSTVDNVAKFQKINPYDYTARKEFFDDNVAEGKKAVQKEVENLKKDYYKDKSEGQIKDIETDLSDLTLNEQLLYLKEKMGLVTSDSYDDYN